MTDNWRNDALCLGAGNHLYFGPDGADAGYYNRARRICALCPVREECLVHALTEPEHHGMWGGLTPTERRNLVYGRFSVCRWCSQRFVAGRGRYCSDPCRTAARQARKRQTA